MADARAQTTDLAARAWRGMETAPEGECVQLIAFAHTDWIFATFQNGWWEDANGSPVQALAWRPANAE